MLVEKISTESSVHSISIYCSEQFNPFESHGKVQLEFTIE